MSVYLYIYLPHALHQRPEEESRESEKAWLRLRRGAAGDRKRKRGDVVVIATAETEQEIRAISMRKAQRNEKEIYSRNL